MNSTTRKILELSDKIVQEFKRRWALRQSKPIPQPELDNQLIDLLNPNKSKDLYRR
jgi:hypothetical protein